MTDRPGQRPNREETKHTTSEGRLARPPGARGGDAQRHGPAAGPETPRGPGPKRVKPGSGSPRKGDQRAGRYENLAI